MDDPIQTYDFIKDIIEAKKSQIIGIAVPKGDRLKLAKGKSKLKYLLTLFIIMGLFSFSKNVITTLLHKLKHMLSNFGLADKPGIIGYAIKNNIPVKIINTPNNSEFINYLSGLNIDIMINQSQSFLKKNILSLPKYGTLNRHNALLPKNRGRLTPFWVLFNGESETGVSIHFVEESMDSGDIIVQEKFKVADNESFNTLVKKNYSIASKAMIKALDRIENGFSDFKKNDDSKATYNSTPLLKDALMYRFFKK